ncbi:unnamed protein product [Linum trigynum]|uniref:Uncharacterized protein n=1 Tax=Linum trigynum TaxID=586398 RepID=A0AAV2ECR8_9ROSI
MQSGDAAFTFSGGKQEGAGDECWRGRTARRSGRRVEAWREERLMATTTGGAADDDWRGGVGIRPAAGREEVGVGEGFGNGRGLFVCFAFEFQKG